VYIKLRNGVWVLINKKIEQTTITKRRRATRNILAGETIDPPKWLEEPEICKFTVPGGVVNKVISRLLDIESEDVVIIEPLNKEHYIIRTHKDLCSNIEKILSNVITKKKRGEPS
jgi:hypothetical protein